MLGLFKPSLLVASRGKTTIASVARFVKSLLFHFSLETRFLANVSFGRYFDFFSGARFLPDDVDFASCFCGGGYQTRRKPTFAHLIIIGGRSENHSIDVFSTVFLGKN